MRYAQVSMPGDEIQLDPRDESTDGTHALNKWKGLQNCCKNDELHIVVDLDIDWYVILVLLCPKPCWTAWLHGKRCDMEC